MYTTRIIPKIILNPCLFWFLPNQIFFFLTLGCRSMKENISNCSLGLIQCFKEGAFNSHKYRADWKKSCKWWAEKKEAFNRAEITWFIALIPRIYAVQSGAPSPGACQRTKIISKCLLIYTQIPQSTQAILQGQLQDSLPYGKSGFRFVTKQAGKRNFAECFSGLLWTHWVCSPAPSPWATLK